MKRRSFLKLLGAGTAGIVAAPAFAKDVIAAATKAPVLWLDNAANWCCRVYYRADMDCWVRHYYAPKGREVYEYAARFDATPNAAQCSLADQCAQASFRRAGINVNINTARAT